MKAKFSESSYSFAIVHQLLKDQPGSNEVPKFPTLQREAYVGYDVTIDYHNSTISLQFKVSTYLKKSNAIEYDCHNKCYYRIDIAKNQHDKLKIRANNKGRVGFYVAPMFHCEKDFRETFYCETMLEKSIWIPRTCFPRYENSTIRCVTFTDNRKILVHYKDGKPSVPIECGFSWKRAQRIIAGEKIECRENLDACPLKPQ